MGSSNSTDKNNKKRREEELKKKEKKKQYKGKKKEAKKLKQQQQDTLGSVPSVDERFARELTLYPSQAFTSDDIMDLKLGNRDPIRRSLSTVRSGGEMNINNTTELGQPTPAQAVMEEKKLERSFSRVMEDLEAPRLNPKIEVERETLLEELKKEVVALSELVTYDQVHQMESQDVINEEIQKLEKEMDEFVDYVQDSYKDIPPTHILNETTNKSVDKKIIDKFMNTMQHECKAVLVKLDENSHRKSKLADAEDIIHCAEDLVHDVKTATEHARDSLDFTKTILDSLEKISDEMLIRADDISKETTGDLSPIAVLRSFYDEDPADAFCNECEISPVPLIKETTQHESIPYPKKSFRDDRAVVESTDPSQDVLMKETSRRLSKKVTQLIGE